MRNPPYARSSRVGKSASSLFSFLFFFFLLTSCVSIGWRRWGGGFNTQALAAEGKKCHILNPIVGPEALTGSTRMKGGSATKIILEVVIALGLKLQQQKAGQASTVVVEVAAMLGEYERTVRSTYFSAAAIANLVELAGASLKAGGHVYYLGKLQCLTCGCI